MPESSIHSFTEGRGVQWEFVCLFVCGQVVVVVVRRQLIARPNSKPELIMENTNMLAS